MLTILDARTNERVQIGLTVRYHEAPADAWVLLGCHDEGDHAFLCWKRIADGMQFSKRIPIHGYWIFRTAVLDAVLDSEDAEKEPEKPPEEPT